MKRFNENAYNVRKNVTIFQLTVQTNHWPEFTGVRSADRRLVLAGLGQDHSDDENLVIGVQGGQQLLAGQPGL